MSRGYSQASTLEAVASAIERGGAGGTVRAIRGMEEFAVVERSLIHHTDHALANQARAILQIVQERG
eukprot:1175785-Prorocentrum_minimum.AAC.1